jgi:hypothetical protein
MIFKKNSFRELALPERLPLDRHLGDRLITRFGEVLDAACSSASSSSRPNSLLPCPRTVLAQGVVDDGADGVELLVRCRFCGHRGHVEEESAK